MNAYWILLAGMIATLATRFVPFLVFGGRHSKHPIVRYLGDVLPATSISLLVVYVFKDVDISQFNSFIPTVVATLSVVSLHLTFKQNLISITGGTIVYMMLVQYLM